MSIESSTPQLMLPGQAAAPDGPIDMSGMYVMHRGFRRDLDRFVDAVPTTDLADRQTWAALAKRWRLFSLVLHRHHSGEDAGLWPLLLDHVDTAADGAARSTLEAMEAEHAGIDPLLDACRRGFERLAVTTDPDARAALEVRLVAARQSLGEHLAHEERDAIALIQRYLTPAEWSRLEKDYFQAEYTLRESLHVLPWVLHDLPDDAREAVFAQPGAGSLRLPWRLVLRPWFERTERRAFGSAG